MGAARQKTGGRQRGTSNVAQRKRISVADKLENLNVDLIGEIWKEVMLMSGKERADCLLKLLEYCAPKMKAVEISEAPKEVDDDELDRIPRDRIVELLKGLT